MVDDTRFLISKKSIIISHSYGYLNNMINNASIITY